MLTIRTILALTDAFREKSGLADKTISNRIFGDSKKIARLRAGADLTTARFNAALQWFSDHWPAGQPWPADIDRPDPAIRPAQSGRMNGKDLSR